MLLRNNVLQILTKHFHRVPRKDTSSDRIIHSALENLTIKCLQDWKKVREEILTAGAQRGQINSKTIDSMTIGVCTEMKKYDLACSYLDFLNKEKININLATLGRYFKLLHARNSELGQKLSKDEEEQFLSLYRDLRKKYPVLDSFTLANVIPCLSLTKNWKDCLKLLEEIKVTSTPGVLSYSSVIAAGFHNHHDEIAWDLLKEMLDSGNTPSEMVYLAYLDRSDKISPSYVGTLLQFLRENHLVITTAVADKLREVCGQANIKIDTTVLSKMGRCKCCKNQLQTLDLTDDEFTDMKKKVIENVIVGKDVFHKTTQLELDRFKAFVANMKHHQVVIDGLNVAYSSGNRLSPIVYSGLVASVVRHFVRQGKRTMVLGRNHMERWPKKNWNYVKQNATVFLTQDLSQDDPYLLYCALNSGRNTLVVSKDLMRGHKFLLKNYHLKCLFDRWLTQRQYFLKYVDNSGNPHFTLPLPYSELAQKNGEYWHVPYEDVNHNKDDNRKMWLCLKLE